VEAFDGLTPEEQADLFHLMKRRLAHLGRQRVVAEVKEARQDVDAGRGPRHPLPRHRFPHGTGRL